MRCEIQGDVAVLHLNAGKANAMGRGFLEGLDRVFAESEASDARAVVLTGYETYFSAGLNLPELLPLSRDDMQAFIGDFHRVMLRVFRCPKPVVAAINGHAIAGGCVLAMQADRRVMADGGYRIGLNEAQLGLGLPPVVLETMRCHIPASTWNSVMLEGRLFTAREAKEIQIVDEFADGDRVLPIALEAASRRAKTPSYTYAQIKTQLRAPAVAAITANAPAEHERWLDTWFADETRRRIEDAVSRIGAKKS
jgi:enoyl-CoA hydratase